MSADLFSTALEFISSPSFQWVEVGLLAYGGLLWLAIIIWVTRDSIHRSRSLLFQTFAILLNLLIPLLGVLLYLIIRPSQTLLERYYHEMEQRLLREAIQEKPSRKKRGVLPSEPAPKA